MNTASPNADWAGIFRRRRDRIRTRTGGGLILWPGHAPQPRNYAGNTYPFRQNSHFLYVTGLAEPDLLLLSLPEAGHDILFGDEASLDDVVWTGPRPALGELAKAAGIDDVRPTGSLRGMLDGARKEGVPVHYLPPYQHSSVYALARLFDIPMEEVGGRASALLMEQVALERSVKGEEEVAEIEEALGVTARMHRAAMAAARPGMRESELAGLIQGIALAEDRAQAYDPIVTVHGEVLHNHSYRNVLAEGGLVLNDSGAESPLGYASDITRTFPVSGRFSPLQADLYRAVLRTQLGAIAMIRPGVSYREVHLGACLVLAGCLRDLGLMKGDPAAAVEAGAHALFLPHGIGHMLGLDVHDMEDLGDVVGHGKEKRPGQFGLNYLRLSRPLEAGFVLTVEPGVYFIPALIERWRAEGLHREFLDYDRIAPLTGFGGIRIEDNVLVTPEGARILGPPIPKTVAEVEAACAR